MKERHSGNESPKISPDRLRLLADCALIMTGLLALNLNINYAEVIIIIGVLDFAFTTEKMLNRKI